MRIFTDQRTYWTLLLVIVLAGCMPSFAPSPVQESPPSPTTTTPPTDTPVPPTNTPVPPTDTPTPMPTDTPVPPTDTPVPPTATRPPTATPAPTPIVTIPRGWSPVVDTRLGYSLATPFGWLTFDLQGGDLDRIAGMLGGETAARQLREFLDSPDGENIGILAVEPDVTQLFARPPFPMFLNVSVAPLADGITDEQLTAFVERSTTLFGDAQLESIEIGTINNLRAIQVVGVSDLSSRGINVNAHLVITGLHVNQKIYILTMATRQNTASSKQALIDQIIGTFRPE